MKEGREEKFDVPKTYVRATKESESVQRSSLVASPRPDKNAQRCMRPKRLSLAGWLSPKPPRGIELRRVWSPDRGESNKTHQFMIPDYRKVYSRKELPVVAANGNIHPLSTSDRDLRDLGAGGRYERFAEWQHAIYGCDPVRDWDAWVQAQNFLHVIVTNSTTRVMNIEETGRLRTLITAFSNGIFS